MKKAKLFAAGSAAAAAAAATASAAVFIKKKGICVPCLLRRGTAAVQMRASTGKKYDNGLALTPPMGWSSWNLFRHRVNEKLIYEMAVALKESGLADAGYQYVNLDDCWQSSMRDREGRLTSDLSRFPSGIPDLVQKVNALGLKLGIYSSNGTLTCEDLPASLGNEALDAETFAQWGVEYLKYDFCHNIPLPTRAPDIDKISISAVGSSDELVFEAENGQLFGMARIEKDDQLESGKYVTGLCSGNGKLYFPDIPVPEDGEYVLTIGIRKGGDMEKYLEIKVNDTEVYDLLVPATKGWTHEGRMQLRVFLKAGSNSMILYNPIGSRYDSAIRQYTKMGELLKRASAKVAEETGKPEKKIVFSICEWGRNLPYKWGAEAGNLWRTTPDIQANWASIMGIYEINVHLWKYAGPGGWNDPDMLEVGNGNLTLTENVAHFSLWCMMAAPLLLGNDLRRFVVDGKVDTSNPVLKILANKDLIAIDQDPLGIPCRRVYTNGIIDVLARPLKGNRLAVCFLNKALNSMRVKIRLSELAEKPDFAFPAADKYFVRDAWSGEETVTTDEIKGSVPSHGVRVYVVEQHHGE